MNDRFLQALISTVQRTQQSKPSEGEMITLSETVSAAAAFYETIRNSLEYDEEHLLRRNAIRRILKRRWGEESWERLGADLLHELIWARYLPNKGIPVTAIGDISCTLHKYQPLFLRAEDLGRGRARTIAWLFDLLSAELEYQLCPPLVEESLASFCYQDLKFRLEWAAHSVKSEDHDLQLYLAVHRAIMKSNVATLRFRLFTLYYPEWVKSPDEKVRETVAGHLSDIMEAVERQIHHPAAHRLFRLIQRQAVAYHILGDLVTKHAFQFEDLLADSKHFQKEITIACTARYDRFQTKIRRSVLRAVAFLFFTKTVLALIIELPYDFAVAKTTNFYPLATNIIFHPLLLGMIGLTVRIPEQKNTVVVYAALRSIVGMDEPVKLRFSPVRRWAKGVPRTIFDVLYGVMFIVSVSVIIRVLKEFHFNALSITFFLFFLSLVTFFGLKIRGSRRELVMFETGTNIWSILFDLFLLPIVRLGRWVSMRAPRINIFLFFFDFIIEAPFKSAIRLIEGWFAFLREKREEI
ncbi:MAG: hypothetical protein UU48_C0007G0025 [Candidatus Uhrbacteria bacterium GW2011_GWF2_41_16]|uniref:Uncharacterized protein n=2 Tax=Candidatus Uhriibacteriota TaxID=1752732 RepID=A0A0G0YC32_9BACT|nr:MAG: hypothetical protein UU35_C0005G0018 [Candidatus Uhrbacteria bacterium GW2011_GWC2_41_11]KKR97892.1 MAG: hypothetical protein UU48_C0007G0025 [Candidatus Uhrbacteria bacterium GW2011_GWF2_41_16]HBO99577.1 hypothetical protein [Candidatus Uhrbacteria bacterium]